jgi:2-polyprenyl-3-methyl-5-hydroxy-6-metoxy-1,4-benzoquinol methylase
MEFCFSGKTGEGVGVVMKGPAGNPDAMIDSQTGKSVRCVLCGYAAGKLNDEDIGSVRGNTERFHETWFRLWKCPECESIRSMEPVDFADIYRDYPLNRLKLDVFSRGTLGNLLSRLGKAGMKKTDRILDYGCGNGLFVKLLRERGYVDVTGYDPYVGEFAERPSKDARFEWIILNDVIEHVEDPCSLVDECAAMLPAGGHLYVGTAEADGVDIASLERHRMRLHQPFHRVLLSRRKLRQIGSDAGLERVKDYTRSYMDTLRPFTNYRFLDEFNKANEHNLDRALSSDAGRVLLRKPRLLLYAIAGYFCPSAYEPAVLLRKAG